MASGSHASFVWFWTFWHWSQEGYATGELARDPLQAIGSHWDEWYHHAASAEDRERIEGITRNEVLQRDFLQWLFTRWSERTEWKHNPLIPRYIAGRLARLAPFDGWPAMAEFRGHYGVEGPSAVILAEHSEGQSDDVRQVEALVLPIASQNAERVVAEGFQVEREEVNHSRQAARSVLTGSGLLAFLGLWLTAGRRPYPRWVGGLLAAGWVALGLGLVFLLYGPDPQGGLEPLCAGLLAGWLLLVSTALIAAGLQVRRACTGARSLRECLDGSQIRLHMAGGLTVKGGSAGLAFCLNILLALHRALPAVARTSWLWRLFFGRLEKEGTAWAATGVVTPGGWIRPVVLDPKVAACSRHARIRHLLTPWQPRVQLVATGTERGSVEPSPLSSLQLGYAAEAASVPTFQSYRAFHLVAAMSVLGRMTDRGQLLMNGIAVAVSIFMTAGLADLSAILIPPTAPTVSAPASPSPYYLWVSLDTTRPRAFGVVLESKYWVSRRALVAAQPIAPASVRAEIRLVRVSRPQTSDVEDGTVWIERRRCFLSRDFLPGERVGQYSLSYLFALRHE